MQVKSVSVAESHSAMRMEHVRFAKEEQERRKQSPVLVKWEDTAKQLGEHRHIYMVDPRLGFNNRTHRLWVDRLAPHSEEGGQMWKTLGHRHTVEAVIYFLTGSGYSIVDGKRYDWKAGDLLCVPMFAWHRHVNDTDEPVLRIASTTGPLSMGLGQAVYEDERHPEFWTFAQEGEEMMSALVPGGVGDLERLGNIETTAGRLYAEQITWAAREERARRESRVLVKGEELRFESSAMGNLCYMVDPRVGFYQKVLGTLMAEIPAGKRSGAHRHLYDEIDFVVSGRGKAIINDQEYEIGPWDTLALPVWAWHQFFNTGEEPLRILSISTRLAMENLGLTLTHQGELADH